MTSAKGIGIPIKLMHESEGHIVTVELKSGAMFRGELSDTEDNWNCQLKSVRVTAKDGKISHLEHVFIRGGQIRFMIIPDMLKNAPMFKRIDPKYKNKFPMGSSTVTHTGRGGRS